MKNYYRIMLGKKSVYADECHKGNFIGADFDIKLDLTRKLPDNWRHFNKEFIPVLLKTHPEKTKVSAGLACGALWTIAKGLQKGDIVLCPNGSGSYLVGEISEDYTYQAGKILPHRRGVKWYQKTIDRSEMSEALQNSSGSIGTVSTVTKFAEEIEGLIAGARPATIISTDNTVEDPSEFALEKHLEDFLIKNWKQTELGKNYDVFEEDGELVGQQYPSDTGPIDILAISKDKNVDRWYKSRTAGCFLYFEDEGLFNGASAKVIGEKGLDGKDSDPKKVWKGGDGEVGGNAGLISVFTSRDLDPFSGVISNQFGKGGKGGSGAFQIPGKGVAASIDPVSRRVSEHHWVGCLVKRQGKLVERHDFANPAIRSLDLSFSIGSPSSYNGYGEASGKLEVRRGKDGASLAPEVIASLNGVDGKDGVSAPPELIYLSKSKFLESQTEQCPDCSPLKIVMEKNHDE